VAITAQDLDVAFVEQSAAVAKFVDMITANSNGTAILIPVLPAFFAPPPASRNDLPDEATPFGAQIEGIGCLCWRPNARRRARDAGLEGGQRFVAARFHQNGCDS
jgi:hypothetical protein